MKLGRSKDRKDLQSLLPKPFSLVFPTRCFHNYYHPLADFPIQLVVSFFIAKISPRTLILEITQAFDLVNALANSSQGEYRKREQQQMVNVTLLLMIHLLTYYCNKYFRKLEGSDFSFPSFFKQIKGHELKAASLKADF